MADDNMEFDFNSPPKLPPPHLTPNLAEGLRRRDAGIALVAENAGRWFDRALHVVSLRCARGAADERFPGEQIRRWVVAEIGEPHSHKAWGALVFHATKRGIIIDVDERQKMTKPSSHGRKTPVYRWGEP